MLVWVLGSQGMLGQEMVRTLRARHIDVFSSSHKDIDITDLSMLFEKAPDAEIIINCVGYTQVDHPDDGLAYLVNGKGPENLARVAEKKSAKLIHFSTDYVFNGEKTIAYREEDRTDPINVYGLSKLEGEQNLISTYTNAVIIRTSWLIGKEGKNFFSSMLAAFQKNEEVRVVSDQTGRLTFCEDLVAGTINLFPQIGFFHFANQGAVTWYEAASFLFIEAKKRGFPMICKRVVPVSTAEYNASVDRPMYSVLSTRKYESLYGSIRNWKEATTDFLDALLVAEKL